ncbi:Bromodomain-containing 7 [Mycena indigotica]|uniref:Bromodomain-containing 7 n=1 Tax=Mycena indigotica TaxID=2126181 RepID=A0A8H6S173_9AGAR|nr:Bromodomain-containing 7 [Mycena indigotica]KAF7290811.1 Bromodomain-containing 7 [Mycena indigotica]
MDYWSSGSSTGSQSDSESPDSAPPAPPQSLPKLKLILPPRRDLQPPPVIQQTPRVTPNYYEPPIAGPSKKSKSSKPKTKGSTSKSKSKSKRKFAFSEYADEKAPPKPVKLKPLKEVLARLLAMLKKKDDYLFFSKPVNASQVPGYSDIIKRPMDFGTMSIKVQRGRYRSLEEFTEDFRLVTGNAKLFNPPDNIYHTEAERIEAWGLDQITKAASTVIQYETDWNIEIEKEDDTAEDYTAALEEAEMAGPERSRSPSIGLGFPALVSTSFRRGPLRPRAAKDNAMETNPTAAVKELIDAEGRMPGSKEGLGAFPPGSAWARTMLSLKLKAKKYKTKKERLRIETHGPPTRTDGSLDYRAIEDPFTHLSALVPDPLTRPLLTPIFPPPPPKPQSNNVHASATPSRDTPDPIGETPAPNITNLYPLPTLLPQDLRPTPIPSIPSNLRHWTVHRNFGNRRPLDPPPVYERSWEEPREAHILDFGSFAKVAGLLHSRIGGVVPELHDEAEKLAKDAVKATVEAPPRHLSTLTNVFEVRATEPEKEYWGKERKLEAEGYIIDMLYGGVEGLAYVRSLAEFISSPPLDTDEEDGEDIKMEDIDDQPDQFPLGCSLASWVEQNIVTPLVDGRSELIERVVRELGSSQETKGRADEPELKDDKLPAQIALAQNVPPCCVCDAQTHSTTDVTESENEWAGKAIGVAAGIMSTPAQTKAVLDYTAKLIVRMQTSVKTEEPDDGEESKSLRELRLNLLALVRRAPMDMIAMLPPELIKEDLRALIPTLPPLSYM